MMILGVLFFGACSVVVAFKAAGNENGIRLFRFIEWSPEGANRFYLVLSIATGVFALVALFGLGKRLTCPQQIVLDDSGLDLPKSMFSRESLRAPFTEIASVSVSEVMGERTLRIALKDGKKKEIVQNHLPSRQAFDEIAQALQERTVLVPPPGRP